MDRDRRFEMKRYCVIVHHAPPPCQFVVVFYFHADGGCAVKCDYLSAITGEPLDTECSLQSLRFDEAMRIDTSGCGELTRDRLNSQINR